jgi:hypothetical protein
LRAFLPQKLECYQKTAKIISLYYANFNWNFYSELESTDFKRAAFAVAFLRSEAEKYHSRKVREFIITLGSQSRKEFWEYKDSLRSMNYYNFQASPISHLKYGIKTAESFLWKMSLFAVEKKLAVQKVERIAQLLASQSLEALLLLDGILWDKLQFTYPQYVCAQQGEVFIDYDRANLILNQAQGVVKKYPLVGCPALRARIFGEPLISFLTRRILLKVEECISKTCYN